MACYMLFLLLVCLFSNAIGHPTDLSEGRSAQGVGIGTGIGLGGNAFANVNIILHGNPNVHSDGNNIHINAGSRWWDADCNKKRPALCVKKENSCLEGWSHYPPTGSCFKTLDEKLYWEEAKTTCAAIARGSSLAKITTSEENNFVVDLMKQNDKNERVGYWMGANDVGREGFYVWLDGSKVVPYWKRGEPNGGKNENCIHWFKEHNYGWNDASCTVDYNRQRGMSAVCKMPAL